MLKPVSSLQYIGKEPQEGKNDVGLCAKRARRWAAILKRFNEDREEWKVKGEEPWTLKRLKDLRYRI